MSITAADISQKKFMTKFRGLDAEEVYAFLEVIKEDIYELEKENAILRERISRCRDEERKDVGKNTEVDINHLLLLEPAYNPPHIKWKIPETSDELEADEYFVYCPEMKEFLAKRNLVFRTKDELEIWIRNNGKSFSADEITKPVINYPTPDSFADMLGDVSYLISWQKMLKDISAGNSTLPMPIVIDVGCALYAFTGTVGGICAECSELGPLCG